MAISATALAVAGTIATVASTGLGIYSSLAQSRAQQAQAEYQSKMAQYQADVARENQNLAEQQASAQRREGYENMIAKRQATAKLIGKQRAAAGASGAAVDVGSNLDLQTDTAAEGEIDAINLYNQGLDKAYNYEIQAWNYGNNAAAYDSQAGAYDTQASSAATSGWMNAVGTGLGGIAAVGSTWGKYAGSSSESGAWVNNNQDYVTGNGTLTKMRSRAGKVTSV